MFSRPRSLSSLASSRARLGEGDLASLEAVFAPFFSLPDPSCIDKRMRIYTALRSFWLFLGQVLRGNGSCREAVQCAAASLAPRIVPSPSTAAYCKARSRLPLAWLRAVYNGTRGEPGGRWCGLSVKVVDGTSVRLPDTAANQALYPQPKTQKPGCGFPVLHLVALFSLATGCIERFQTGRLYENERALFAAMRAGLSRGDLVLADRGFCGWAEFFKLQGAGIEALMRKHQRLGPGLRTVRMIGEGDRIAAWRRTDVPSAGYIRDEWKELPAEIVVREVTFDITEPGFRTKRIVLLTTLLDPRVYTREAIAALYRRRWEAELHFDEIKTAMGMHELRCRTPAMVERELLMYIIAYNLIRLTMCSAAKAHRVCLARISFAGTIAVLRRWTSRLAAEKSARRGRGLWKLMLAQIAADQVPTRPGRREPRVKKRKEGSYPILTVPRHKYVEIAHRKRYRKSVTQALS